MAKVLVVDDDAGVVSLLKDHLRELGHRVATAGDAEGAKAAIRADKPDLMILDHEMPGGSGGALAKELAADQTTADLRIIFLTGLPLSKVSGSVTPSPRYRFLTKPLIFDIFDRTLREFLGPSPAGL